MALSLDLRQRVLAAYQKGEGSIRQLAERFSIGASSVWRLLKNVRVEGRIEANKSPGRRPLVGEKEKKIILKLIEANNETRLKDLCQGLKQKTGIEVSVVTMHKVCKRMKLTYKKKSVFN